MYVVWATLPGLALGLVALACSGWQLEWSFLTQWSSSGSHVLSVGGRAEVEGAALVRAVVLRVIVGGAVFNEVVVLRALTVRAGAVVVVEGVAVMGVCLGRLRAARFGVTWIVSLTWWGTGVNRVSGLGREILGRKGGKGGCHGCTVPVRRLHWDFVNTNIKCKILKPSLVIEQNISQSKPNHDN